MRGHNTKATTKLKCASLGLLMQMIFSSTALRITVSSGVDICFKPLLTIAYSRACVYLLCRKGSYDICQTALARI